MGRVVGHYFDKRLTASRFSVVRTRPRDSAPELTDPHVGSLPLDVAIDQFYTADVFMHTWDLARATGQDDRLDPEFCAALLGHMEQMADVIRASGQFGVRVEVPDGADTQTRLLGFIGRDPFWRGRLSAF